MIHSKYGNTKYMESKWLWKYENIKYGNVSYNFNKIYRFTSLHSFYGLQMIFPLYIYIYVKVCEHDYMWKCGKYET